MNIVYNIGIKLLGLVIYLASLRNEKAKQWINGRKGLLEKIKEEVKAENLVWVHCASLGEFEQGRPLIEEMKRKYPEKQILLTFFSPSGYNVQKNYSKADYVYFLPLDTYRNAKRFIRLIKPEVVFFIKYEYWNNYLTILKKNNIPIYFVSSIFRKDQLFFKSYGKWYRKMLSKVTHFYVQSKESADLLNSIGYENHSVTGDTRFDRVTHIMENVKPLKEVETFINGDKVLVAGSSWKAENALLKQYIRANESLKIILAPHEVNDESIQGIMTMFGDRAVKYSEVNPNTVKNKQVLVVDCYGVLTSLYQYGTLALVGGGFGVGIHNVLEAAAYGMPVLFGPNYHRFKEAVELIDKKAAFSVNNVEEFNSLMNYLLTDQDLIETISENAASYVKENIGATQKILSQVF